MTRLAAACARLAGSAPRAVLLVGLLVAAAAVLPASRVGFDPTVEGWFLAGDGERERYRDFRDRFGNDEFLLVVLAPESGDVFRNDVLAAVRALAADLRDLPRVRSVHSLDDGVVLESAADTVTVIRLTEGIPLDDAGLARLRDRARGAPLVDGVTVHHGGTATSLFVSVEEAILPERLALVEEVRRVLDVHRVPGVTAHLMGDAVLHEDLLGKVNHDLYRVLPLMVLVVAGVLWLTLRSRLGVVLALSVVGLSVLGARALSGLLGWGDSPLLSLVPVVLVVTGTADAVHVLDRFFRVRPDSANAAGAVDAALRGLFRPCLLTTATTAAGFLAVTTSPLAPLQRLGLLAAFGVGVAFIVTMLLVPAALVWLDPRGGSRRGDAPALSPGLARAVWRRRRVVLALTALTTLAGVAGITRLKVESRYLESFHADDPIRLEAEWIEDHVGGLASLEAVVSVEPPASVLEPAVLEAVRGLEAALAAAPGVTHTRSAAGVVDAVGGVLRGEAAPPPDRRAAAQMLLLYEVVAGDDLAPFLDPDHRRARIRARSRFGTATQVDTAVAAFAACADTVLPAGASAELTGSLLLFRRVSGYLVQSQIRSLLLALLTVTAFLMVALRSVRLGLLSLIPNVWPLVVTLGVMGWVGWWLQPATVMVGAIALGIGVDDSVHFLESYRAARREGHGAGRARELMFERSGRAVTVTTIILVLGFAVSLASSLRETALFAGLCMTALAAAWVGDVFVLPCLLGDDEPEAGQGSPEPS